MKKKSRRLFPIIAVVCVVCFGSVGPLFAADPYIFITLPDVIDFGSIPYPDTHSLSHVFLMTVNATVDYHIEIDLSDFAHEDDNTAKIFPNTLQVTTSTGFGQEGLWDGNVEVGFNVSTTMSDRAGVYNGTLMVTVAPGP